MFAMRMFLYPHLHSGAEREAAREQLTNTAIKMLPSIREAPASPEIGLLCLWFNADAWMLS